MELFVNVVTQQARVEVDTRNTSDFQYVVLNLGASYLADGVTVMYEDGGKLKNAVTEMLIPLLFSMQFFTCEERQVLPHILW